MSENDQSTEEKERKFNQEQYEMLRRCSEKNDIMGWNLWRESDPEIQIDLRGANLSGADLNEADLRGAILNNADLSGAILIGANLSEVKLTEAYFRKADLSDANLSKADLSEANLSGANLSRADLSRADLIGADLIGVDLSEANLSEANLSDANLSRANLIRANLIGVDLIGVDLIRADLSGVDLIGVDLSGADLSEADLSEANLSEANLSDANLIRANLSEANLSGANLSGANLSEVDLIGVDLSRANLRRVDLSRVDLSGVDLSGVVVDEYTVRKARGNPSAQRGVNGLYSRDTDSAALMTMTPPGNSMQGSNHEAVLESLKRSRRLHGQSLSLAGIILLMAVLNIKEMELPWIKEVPISTDLFGLLAMPISIGLLILVNSFLSDAYKGAQYLQDRRSAMSVGNFPWALSRYAGGGFLNKLLSYIVRAVMSFHAVAYVYFLAKWETYNLIGQAEIVNKSVFVIISLLAFAVSSWTFELSERFQKPILFDSRTEAKQQDKLLVELLKPKEHEGPQTNAQEDI